MLPVKVAPSLSFRSSSDARATSSSSVTIAVTLPRLFCVFPTVFEEKRDCSQSSELPPTGSFDRGWKGREETG